MVCRPVVLWALCALEDVPEFGKSGIAAAWLGQLELRDFIERVGLAALILPS